MSDITRLAKKAISVPSRSPPRRPGGVPSGGHPNPGSRISAQKLDPNKFSNPFSTNTSKCLSSFSQSYKSGSIPCRLQTTASRYHLQWDTGAESGFSPDLLLVCAEGLVETDHPYCVMAPLMFTELCLRSEGCAELFPAALLESLAIALRAALLKGGAPKQEKIFDAAVGATEVLLTQTGALLLPALPKLLPALARPIGTSGGDRERRQRVISLLQQFESIGGAEVTKLIKSKIPTY